MKATLQHDLTAIIAEAINSISLPEEPNSLYEPIKYTLDLGGKRIRPLLSLLAAGMCEGDVQDAIPAALAIEVLHNFTLIHDDIMDQAELRRGELAVHKKWDESTAILSGDAMFGKAYELLNFYGEDDRYSKSEFLSMHSSFQYAVKTVCEGQALDMDFVNSDTVPLDDYIQMIIGKTSALLSSALQMGAISAHADSDKVEALFNAGQDMGIAFQIQDDLLDAIADPEKFGKKAGGDIYEGKKTYLSILALERGNIDQKNRLQEILAKKFNSESEVQEVIELYHELSVISDTEKEISNHYDKAFNAISTFGDSSYKEELVKLLLFLKARDH